MTAWTAFSPTPLTAHSPNRITPSGLPFAAAFFFPFTTSGSTYTGVKSMSDTFTSGGRTLIPLPPSGNVSRRHSSMYSTTFSVDPIS